MYNACIHRAHSKWMYHAYHFGRNNVEREICEGENFHRLVGRGNFAEKTFVQC